MSDPFYDGLPDGEDDVENERENDVVSSLGNNELLPPARMVEEGEHVEPVEIEILRVCDFKAKPCKLCGKPRSSKVHTPKRTATCVFKRQNGCASCGKTKKHADHFGAPESFNLFAGRDPNVYRNAIEQWKEVIVPLLRASGLPRGLDHVLVEGRVSFGDVRERDQGNHRVLIEKALGDVLVDEGYLPSDKWDRYEFGGFERREEAGVSRLRLMLFPRAPASAVPDAQLGLPVDFG